MTTMTYLTAAKTKSNRFADNVGFVGIALFAFLNTISTSATSILMAVIVVSFLIGFDWRRKIQLLLVQPMLIVLAAFVLWVIIGALYSPAEPHRITMMIRKSGYLLLVWFICYFIYNNRKRLWIVVGAFAVGCATNIIAIYLNSYVLPYNRSINFFKFPIISHQHYISAIDHFNFAFITLTFSFSCLLFAVKYTGKTRVVLLIVGLVALYAEVFLNSARTGYVMELATAILIYTLRYGKKGLIYATIFVVILFSSAYKLSPVFHSRLNQAYNNVVKFEQQQTNNTSVGLRLAWYKLSWQLLKQRNVGQLIIGSGSGSIHQCSLVYLQQNKHEFPSSFRHLEIYNPHNQFFLTTIENGIIGLLLIFAIFASIAVNGRKLLYPWNYISYAVIIGMVVGCVFNSWLRDFMMLTKFILMSSVLLSCPYRISDDQMQPPGSLDEDVC